MLTDEKILTGCGNGSIKLWSLENVKCIKTLNGHSNWVMSIRQVSTDRIASSSLDRRIKIWNFVTGVCLNTIKASEAVNQIQAFNLIRCVIQNGRFPPFYAADSTTEEFDAAAKNKKKNKKKKPTNEANVSGASNGSVSQIPISKLTVNIFINKNFFPQILIYLRKNLTNR